eukprot:scpid62464/ scgid30473/ Probable D-lactate dehydrogenase, mitochondrial
MMLALKCLGRAPATSLHRYCRLFSSGTERELPAGALAELTAAVGSDGVSTSASILAQHDHDESWHRAAPAQAVVFPRTTQQVSEVAKCCSRHGLPMIPFGTGTGLEGGVCAPQGGVHINVTKMDRVLEVNAEDFDACVEPGVTRKQLNEHLRATGLHFPVDPGADASLCGMAATSASGTNAVRYGTMRENVLNLEVVLSNGQVIHTAGKGRRARKSSAGYNLTNCFVGSEGTLGIITSARIRLYGIPEAVSAAVVSFPSVRSAVETCVQVIQAGIPIARLEYLDENALKSVNSYSGLNYSIAPTLFLEFQGSQTSVEEQSEVAGEIARENGGGDYQWASDAAARDKLWTARHNAFYAALALRPGANVKGVITDVCVPVSHLTEVLVTTQEEIKHASFPYIVIGHVGDGNFHVTFVIDQNSTAEVKEAKLYAENLARRALAKGGTCTGEHGVGMGKIDLLREEFSHATLEAMWNLKRAFDPDNLMNPGKVLPTL